MKRENRFARSDNDRTMIIHTPPGKAPVYITGYTPAEKRPSSRRRYRPHLLFLLLAILILLLCLQFLIASLPKPVPVDPFSSCPALLNAADYTHIINFQPQTQQMAAVQIVKGFSGKAPAALVQVLTPKALNRLDVYAFSCSIQNKQLRLVRIFEQNGLVQGSAEFSKTQTLITETLDSHISSSNIPFLQPLQQNIYREYAWHENRFVQTLFPGFYPVASRLEAEALQQNANNGQHTPWNNPLVTTLQMSKDLLQWSKAQVQLLYQSKDTALVELSDQAPHMLVQVTLKRLIQRNQKGIWFVTDARSRGILLTSPDSLNDPFQTSVTSPVRIGGDDVLIDGHTFATLFDHALRPIAAANKIPLKIQSDSTYTATIPYTHLVPNQQGLLLIESLPQTQNNHLEQGQLLLTSVLLR